jgi:uncharacterized membrane protein YidH (DUF202 family)
MIKNFGDHSSNERTFLAWVRTAIAVMAFGFIVEKFDLFLEVAAPSLAGRTLSVPGQRFGNIVGLALILVGTAMVAIAAIRFLITAAERFSQRRQGAVRFRAPAPANRTRIQASLCRLLKNAKVKLRTSTVRTSSPAQGRG